MPISTNEQYLLGESIGKLSEAVKSLSDNISRHDKKIDELSSKLESFIMDSISRKEFDELKTDVKSLKENFNEKEKEWKVLEVLKNNWKFIFTIITLGASVGVGGYKGLSALNEDIHTIAVAHQTSEQK